MVGDMVRELEARFPWLSPWLGDRLDTEVPAFCREPDHARSDAALGWLLPATECSARPNASSRARSWITW